MRFEIQRADFWKRISAFLFDIMMIGVIVIIVMTGLSAIFKYDDHVATVETLEKEYAEKYNIIQDISQEQWDALTEEEKARYYECDEARMSDPRLVKAYGMLSSLKFALPSVSILIAYIILELVVPIFFKNGQTLGKKAFGLGVIHTNGVRIHGQAHFIRSIIGKCLIETLVPFYFLAMIMGGSLGPLLGLIMLALLLILQIIAVASTKTRSAIHDLIADAVVVDLASQMTFENADELMAYKTRIHEEEANKAEY